MNTPRWYLYTHKASGGLATSLTPPQDTANIDAYEWSGPHPDADIVNKFVEAHNAACKRKRDTTGGGTVEGLDGAA
jgi:hypothetical protein